MLDNRLETFLTLCETGSYTRAAELLHITQPAVTQHIKFLEEEYGSRLFRYAGRTLSLTEKGRLLREYAVSLKSNSEKIVKQMRRRRTENPKLNFGATLTIGEFMMGPVLEAYLKEFPGYDLHMNVSNTKTLLQQLDHSEIDFALIEGNFDKSRYAYQLVKEEEFLPLCGKGHPRLAAASTLDDLLSERLILREEGSGTRHVLETVLHEHNLSLGQFSSLVEIGNFRVIKELAASNRGITFAYRQAVREELKTGRLQVMPVENFKISREFNFVYLKNSVFESEYLEFYSFCQNHGNREDGRQ